MIAVARRSDGLGRGIEAVVEAATPHHLVGAPAAEDPVFAEVLSYLNHGATAPFRLSFRAGGDCGGDERAGHAHAVLGAEAGGQNDTAAKLHEGRDEIDQAGTVGGEGGAELLPEALDDFGVAAAAVGGVLHAVPGRQRRGAASAAREVAEDLGVGGVGEVHSGTAKNAGRGSDYGGETVRRRGVAGLTEISRPAASCAPVIEPETDGDRTE